MYVPWWGVRSGDAWDDASAEVRVVADKFWDYAEAGLRWTPDWATSTTSHALQYLLIMWQ